MAIDVYLQIDGISCGTQEAASVAVGAQWLQRLDIRAAFFSQGMDCLVSDAGARIVDD